MQHPKGLQELPEQKAHEPMGSVVVFKHKQMKKKKLYIYINFPKLKRFKKKIEKNIYIYSIMCTLPQTAYNCCQ